MKTEISVEKRIVKVKLFAIAVIVLIVLLVCLFGQPYENINSAPSDRSAFQQLPDEELLFPGRVYCDSLLMTLNCEFVTPYRPECSPLLEGCDILNELTTPGQTSFTVVLYYNDCTTREENVVIQ